MSFPVDYQTTIDGVTIKCSKPFNELGIVTVDDLREYAIAGLFDIATGRGGNSLTTFTPLGVDGMAEYMPVYYLKDGAFSNHVGYHSSYLPTLNAPHYGFSILTYGLQWQNVRSTTNDARLVLDVDIQKLYVDTPTLYENTINKNNDADISTLDSITYYETHDVGVVKTIDNDSNTQIHCMDVFIYGDQFYIFPSSYVGGMPRVTSLYRWYNNWQSAAADQINTSFIQPYYRQSDEVYAAFADDSSLDGFMFTGIEWGEAWTIILDLPENEREQSDACVVVTYSGSSGWEGNCKSFPKHGLRSALLGFANSCLKFKYNNTMYKPIISQGVVIDYTDDMSEASEFDDIETVTGNNVPIEPPGPTPPGPGYDDDPWSGISFSGVGVGGAGAFAKCYYMTSTELANLRSWMNSNNVPEGFDPMAQIIGLSQVPVILSGDDNSTVQFVNSSAVYDPGVTRLVDSGVTTQIAMGTPIRYALGSVDITRRMQERGEPYLDYDCQIELYLPLIGMFSLDTQAVMGRTITAEAVLDPISGTLAAYAYVSRDGQNLPIAYGSTTIGVDLPISAQQYSVSRAALKQANAQLGASILSSTLSFIAAATAGGKGSGTGAKTATGSTNGLAAAGIREAGADYMKASQAGNVFGDFMQWGRTIRQLSYGNNTAIAGSFGGSTAQWSYPFTPYVKIIRPRYEKPRNYNHSQGVPCVQTKTVGSCTGFIQCIGVDVSGITRATDLERQAIQAALANGVFAGGGS